MQRKTGIVVKAPRQHALKHAVPYVWTDGRTDGWNENIYFVR